MFLITIFEPTTHSCPTETFFSKIVLDPIILFLPILTFSPTKTLFPNLTDLKFFLFGFFKDKSGKSTSANG